MAPVGWSWCPLAHAAAEISRFLAGVGVRWRDLVPRGHSFGHSRASAPSRHPLLQLLDPVEDNVEAGHRLGLGPFIGARHRKEATIRRHVVVSDRSGGPIASGVQKPWFGVARELRLGRHVDAPDLGARLAPTPEEQLLPVGCPGRRRATSRRDSERRLALRKGANPDLSDACFIRGICQPPSVGRKRGVSLAERSLEEDLGLKIWVYDVASRTPQPLTFEGANRYPVWSPDGTRLALRIEDTSEAPGLFWLPADGTGEPQRITTQSGPDHYPVSWSSEGVLVFLSGRDIMFVNVEVGGPGWRTPADRQASGNNTRLLLRGPGGRRRAFGPSMRSLGEVPGFLPFNWQLRLPRACRHRLASGQLRIQRVLAEPRLVSPQFQTSPRPSGPVARRLPPTLPALFAIPILARTRNANR